MGKLVWKLYWQDVANVGLGLWIFVSTAILYAMANATPWHSMLVNLSTNEVGNAAMWNLALAGIAIAFFALFAALAFGAWQEWIILALGLWLLASPWVLDFHDLGVLRWNAVITGILVAALAAWVLTQQRTKRRS